MHWILQHDVERPCPDGVEIGFESYRWLAKGVLQFVTGASTSIEKGCA